MELSAPRVRYEAARGVARITLCDRERHNALGAALLGGLSSALARAGDDPACRVIVLTAEGNTFCSGLDLEEAFAGGRPRADLFRAFAGCLLRIRTSARPVVAGLRGKASGGGVGLAAAADIVVAEEGAELILPEVIVGMIPAIIAPVLLRRVSPGRLGATALGSRPLTAAEAREAGLVDEAVPAGGLAAALDRHLGRLLRSSPDALARTKAHLAELAGDDLPGRLERAVSEVSAWAEQPHVVEGARLFADGLAPPWFDH